MAKLSDLGRSKRLRNREHRRIRNAFTLLVIVSLVALVGFVLLTRRSVLANLGPWKPMVPFAFGLFFAVLSYKGADTAMFGAYVMAFFVSSIAPRKASGREEPRKKAWGLQPYLRQPRMTVLATSAVALVYGVASLLAYLAFLILGSYELSRIFDWQITASIVGLSLGVLTLIAAIPAALGSISAMRTYFASRSILSDQKIDPDDSVSIR
ncbi:MAG TPA: hypothetical protein ENH11_08635 [Candidatus Acetothermia bacterium]|nr:hypothetical protein [Candidatus Acetothermia bacterium]